MTAPLSELGPVVCLMGPTASGKTALAMALVDQLEGEIISVDSAMVYRGMDIGTAKPSRDELARYPHRLVDIRDPGEPYSAADFRDDALREIAAVRASGKLPILAGGTMLYFRALLFGLDPMPPAEPRIREQLEVQWADDGGKQLYERLRAVDPEAARTIHPHNRQRVIRALEVFEVSGRPISTIWSQTAKDGASIVPYNLLQMALLPDDRQALHERIAQRFHDMLEQGLIEEVEALRARGNLSPELPSLRSVGYRQVWDYLAGCYGRETMVQKGIAATRQLAKRQLTWLRRWPELQGLQAEDANVIDKALKICREHATLKKH
ncbi:tRNA (adenosine(37)-N6)-dimethylallyltransferase MiaA [Marinobacteraceae bacterium S3BR75-40.1]